MTVATSQQFLLFRAGRLLCALPIESVVEILRPLPIEPLTGAPHFLLGLSIVRGKPLPVVDLALLLGAEPARERLVIATAGDHRVAIMVSEVRGIEALGAAELEGRQPLVDRVRPEAVSALAALDSELLFVLRAGRIVPDSIWPIVESRGAADD